MKSGKAGMLLLGACLIAAGGCAALPPLPEAEARAALARGAALEEEGDLIEAAANLFAMLRAADARAPRAIAVAPIPEHGLGEAINDRLRRAAGFVG